MIPRDPVHAEPHRGSREAAKTAAAFALALVTLGAFAAPRLSGQAPQSGPAASPAPIEVARPITAAADPFPAEARTRDWKKVSFIVYGDTRGGTSDGVTVHPVHMALMDRILSVVRARANSDRAIRFVLQTGDAVLRGSDAHMWNVSYSPVIDRLTRDGGVPYFLTLGNHDVLPAGRNGGPSGRDNSLRAMTNLYPPAGSARRYGDSATYALAIGPLFVVAIDSNAAADPGQLAWVSSQLEKLDRRRFRTVAAFLHHAPYTSGPHGVAVEPATLAVRTNWIPLFRKHHVRMILAGHEHFFEQWVERYRDGSRSHRMDILVTGGGGAPTYAYRGEPDLTAYLAEGAASQVRVEHLVKPGATNAENPNHFVIIDVDGDHIREEVVALGDFPFMPFDGKARLKLE